MSSSIEKPALLSPAQVPAAIQELFGHESLVQGMRRFLPESLFEHILRVKEEIHTVEDFQAKIIHPVMHVIEQSSVTDITTSGLESLTPSGQYLFISNHRDIVLDSAFMNTELFNHGFPTAPMAVGDNLMRHRISELIFMLNKSFVVKRSGAPMELYRYSLALSAFIHEQIAQGHNSIWIAQREGRAKDGNDRTQAGLLKMLSLSAGEGQLKTFFQSLHIVPVSISYEFDPCAVLKTREFLKKAQNPDYKKSFQEDVDYMLLGLRGAKGRVHIHFGAPLQSELDALDTAPNAKKQLEVLAGVIDRAIHTHYRLHPVNYLAYDLLNGAHLLESHGGAAEKETLHSYFDNQYQQLGEDPTGEGRRYLLGMYAWPVANQLSAQNLTQTPPPPMPG